MEKPMMYKYEVEGTAAGSQTWKINGTMSIGQGDISLLFNAVMQETFTRLTNSKAEYGNPGVGCNGPYHITRIVMEIYKH